MHERPSTELMVRSTVYPPTANVLYLTFHIVPSYK